ncbi:arginase family protein [Methylobacterium sp. WL103]|nr:arginase family protein [Methylobacterium sp. WL103]
MTEDLKTLRLVLPHWQGGNKPTYQLGSRLLAWLAPDNGDLTVEVPVPKPDGRKLPVEDGVVGKSEVLDVARATRAIIEQHQPDRIVTFGGDCMVSIAPFSFLARKHEGDVAVLWIDAHPDVTIPTSPCRRTTPTRTPTCWRTCWAMPIPTSLSLAERRFRATASSSPVSPRTR